MSIAPLASAIPDPAAMQNEISMISF